ncbi:MAG: hypothetical protein ACK4GN_09365 [Runella sp.]
MLFETERQALNFIKFNSEEIESTSGYSPKRAYFCSFCAGWHITHIEEEIGPSRKEQLLEKIKQQEQEKKSKAKSKSNGPLPTTQDAPQESIQTPRQKKYKIIIAELEHRINEIEAPLREQFLLNEIEALKNEIALLEKSDDPDKAKLKELRRKVDPYHTTLKKYGFKKLKEKQEEEKKLEEWTLWMKQKGYLNDEQQ